LTSAPPWLFKSIYHRFSPDADVTLIKLPEALYDHTSTALAESPGDIFELLSGVRQVVHQGGYHQNHHLSITST